MHCAREMWRHRWSNLWMLSKLDLPHSWQSWTRVFSYRRFSGISLARLDHHLSSKETCFGTSFDGKFIVLNHKLVEYHNVLILIEITSLLYKCHFGRMNAHSVVIHVHYTNVKSHMCVACCVICNDFNHDANTHASVSVPPPTLLRAENSARVN